MSNSTSNEAEIETAKGHLAAGRLDDAQAVFEQIVANDPKNAEVHHFLGTLHLDARRYDEAVKSLEISAILAPDVPRLYIDLGNACWAAERNLNAIAAFQKAIDLCTTDETKVLLPLAYESLGNVLYEEKAFGEAFNCFLAVTKLAPPLTEPWVKLGSIALMRGSFDQAADAFGEALNRSPDHFLALINMGHALTSMGRFDSAKQAFMRAIAVEPESREAHHSLGNLYRYQGAHEEAIKSYERAITLAPQNAQYQVSLASSHFDMQAWDQVVTHLTRALELDGNLPTAAFQLAAVKGERPDRMPPECAAALSNGSASLYDGLNLERLSYALPEVLTSELNALDRTFERALDLGCGTGLLGAAIAAKANRLEGIDVSDQMLDLAKHTNDYAKTHEADVISFLDQVEADCDLVVAGDLAPYFGDLTPLLARVARALVPGGVFLLSVQTTDADTWELTKAGRYHHPAAKVASLAAEQGFEIAEKREFILRKSDTDTENGILFVLKRSA